MDDASAQVFLHVLRDSIGGKRGAADMLLPRLNLSALFPEAATEYVKARGGEIRLGSRITGLSGDSYGWNIARARYEGLVLATPAQETANLLAMLAPPESFQFDVEPEVQAQPRNSTPTASLPSTCSIPANASSALSMRSPPAPAPVSSSSTAASSTPRRTA